MGYVTQLTFVSSQTRGRLGYVEQLTFVSSLTVRPLAPLPLPPGGGAKGNHQEAGGAQAVHHGGAMGWITPLFDHSVPGAHTSVDNTPRDSLPVV